MKEAKQRVSHEMFISFLKAKWKEMKAKGAPEPEIKAAKKLYKSAKKQDGGAYEDGKKTVQMVEKMENKKKEENEEEDEEERAEKKEKKEKKDKKAKKEKKEKKEKKDKKRKRAGSDGEEERASAVVEALPGVVTEGGGSGYTAPAPFSDFKSTPFHPSLKTALVDSGFTAPTPIQAQSWPIALAGNDLVSVAKTGSGKTCAYLLPILHKIVQQIESEGSQQKPWLPSPLALVLAPTRELAMQIQEQALKFGKCVGIKSVCIYGGVPKHNQVNSLRGGANAFPHLVVGTPGRLLELSRTNKALSLEKVQVVVLDEADRMLDMGFEPQLDKLAQSIQEGQMKTNVVQNVKLGNCQALFYTATWPTHVQRAAQTFLRPDRVSVFVGGGEGEKLMAHEGITQDVRVINGEDEKPPLLRKTLESLQQGAEHRHATPKPMSISIRKTVVFCARKQSCDEIAEEYYALGYRCASLHSGKEQKERSAIMNAFGTKVGNDKKTPQQQQKDKKRHKAGVMDGYDYGAAGIDLLFATDVAARGLDIADIVVVINYDFPQQQGAGGVEEYVHRIGRAGRRAGVEALAVTFFTEGKDGDSAGELLKILKSAKQQVPPQLEKLARETGAEDGETDDITAKQAKRDAKKEKKKRAKEQREGDWICMSCGASVFAAKDACFKCGKPKPP
jgi:ATP-dependent RNA helicase DDX5/DBP2